MNANDYDILIVGGGLVGASLALGLNQLSLKTGLIDSTLLNQPSNPAAEISDGRTIVLSTMSCQILQALSSSSLTPLQTQPVKTIHISKQGQFAITRLKASDVGLSALGYSIEMGVLTRFLYKELGKTTCELIPAEVNDAKDTSNRIELTLKANELGYKLSTKLLIAADGDNSLLREWFKIPVECHDYQQSAFVTTVETNKPCNATAFERFIPAGSIALLPVAEKKFKLVWIKATEEIKKLAQLSPEIMLDKLQKHLGSRAGKFEALGKNYFTYPLKYLHVAEQVQERFVLMGNAAHVLHPIAAQGFNLSLRDIAVFIETIRHALTENKNFASKEILQSYLVKRLPDQKRAENLTHRLASLFTQDLWLLKGMQSGVFHALECFPPVKRRFIRLAMGSFVRLPKEYYPL